MRKTLLSIMAGVVLAAPAFAADAPSIKVVPCDGCAVDQSIIKAIEDGYAKALGEKPGAGEAVVKITSFQQRDAAARLVLGVLSGKDMIAANVESAGQTFQVEDSARSGFCGIECVGGNIGAQVAEKLAPEKVEAAKKAANEYR